MRPQQRIHEAQRGMRPIGAMTDEADRLEDIAARLMTVQRYWNAPTRQAHLAAALADSRGVWHGIQAALAEGGQALPADVQHNLLILSVYAESKIGVCEASPSTEALGSLVALTRTLASSLREWREAA